MTKVVLFNDAEGMRIGQCDITDAGYDLLAEGDTLVSFNGELFGYSDATADYVVMTPRMPHLLLSVGEPGAPAYVVPADPSGDVARLAAVSDLFFNADHPERDGYVERQSGGKLASTFDPDEYRNAIRKDAIDFCNTFGTATGITLNVDDVVRDFLDRE